MIKHVFIGDLYYNDEDMIEYIMFNTIKQHFIFDENNKLLQIKKLNSLDDDNISEMTIGQIYEFKNGFPLPFYNYYKDYKCCCINLSNEQLDELKHYTNLIHIISDYDMFDKFLYKKTIKDILTNIKSEEIIKNIKTLYDNFITNFNKTINKDQYKQDYINDILQEIKNKYKTLCEYS